MTMDSVELAMALEQALESGDRQAAELRPYLVDPPVAVSCIKGGFETEVVIYARHGRTVFFLSMDAPRFGVGETNEFGDVVEAYHYPNIGMALRAFAGAVDRRP